MRIEPDWTGLVDVVPYRRLIIWLGAASILSLALYPQQVSTLLSSVAGASVENLGNYYALAALLFVGVFFMLRWQDLRSLLLKEGKLRAMPIVRLVGLALCLLPLLLVPLLRMNEDATSIAVFPIFMVFWGVFLLINPTTLRLTFPYSAALLAATLLPFPLTALVGEPLVGVASFLSRLFLSATGIPYLYASLPSPELLFSSRGGSSLALSITPFCSSLSSISVFLLLVFLMHIDLKKDLSSTVKMAFLGTVALVLLNSLRIAALAWVGFFGGPDLLASVHGWIGYTIFVAFYAVAAFAYINSGRRQGTIRSGEVTDSESPHSSPPPRGYSHTERRLPHDEELAVCQVVSVPVVRPITGECLAFASAKRCKVVSPLFLPDQNPGSQVSGVEWKTSMKHKYHGLARAQGRI